VPTTLSSLALTPESDLPIALRSLSPLYCFELSSIVITFLYMSFLSFSVTIPKTVREALAHPDWRQVMTDELCALHNSGTWELVTLSSGKSIIGYRWVFAIKVEPDGTIDRLKDRLVAKGYTQLYYGDIFSP